MQLNLSRGFDCAGAHGTLGSEARAEWRFHFGPVFAGSPGREQILILNEISRKKASGFCPGFPKLGVLDSRDVSSLALPNGEVLKPRQRF